MLGSPLDYGNIDGCDETFELMSINDILQAAGCSKEVHKAYEEWVVPGHIQSHCPMRPKECVEVLQWVLEKTNDPIRVLHVLCGDYTLYFLNDMDKTSTDGLFDGAALTFYEDFCKKSSVRLRLAVVLEALKMAERHIHVRVDMLYFAMKLLAELKFPRGAPAHHRRNLIYGALETVSDDEAHRVTADLRCVSLKDVMFGVEELKRVVGQH